MSENVGNDAKSTLHTGVDATITSWVVDNPTSGPAYPAVNFRVRLGTAATGELVLVTAASDNGNGTSNWTVTRGVESTTNQAWIAGTVIEHVLTAASLQAVAAQAAGYYPVTQASHGFTQGKAVYFNGTVWALADASDGTKLALGLVGDVATNTFNFYYSGVIGGLTGLTANRYYFVDPSTPGALTLTDPLSGGTVGQFSNPVLYSLSTTVGLVLPFRPAAVQASLWPGTSASLIAGDGSNVASARTKLDEVAATTITSLTAATTTAYGTAKLSVAPASATAPIAVGDNDTRLTSRIVNGGRLTLTTGVPVTTSDVATATSVYWTPYLHGSITLWTGTVRQTVVSAEVSVSLGTITTLRPYDVFGYLSGGALVLEILAWTGDVARATALSYQNGMLCKTGDATRRYLGTFRTISTTQTTDSKTQRFLWNMDNRVPRELAVFDTTASWTWASATGYRQVRATATNMVEVVLGLGETPISADATLFVGLPATPQTVATAIGLDSTTAAAGDQVGGGTWGPTSGFCTAHAHYRGIPAVGYHYLAWLEGRNISTGTMTYYGSQSAPNMISSGLVGVTVQ